MNIQTRIELFLFNRIGHYLEKCINTAERKLYYSNLLSQEFFPETITKADNWKQRLITYQFRKNYNPTKPSPFFRQIIKESVWGGKVGQNWHEEEGKDDPELDKYGRWRNIQLNQCHIFLSKHPEIKQIIEVGCGNGKYLQQIQNTFGNPYAYLGIDLSVEQINWNQTHYPDIQFIAGAAEEMKTTEFKEGNIFITFGTLSCFTETELETWLNQIHALPGFQALCIAEWNESYDPELEMHSQPMSPTLYNHPYKRMVIKAGFEINALEYNDSSDIFPGYTRTILTAHKS